MASTPGEVTRLLLQVKGQQPGAEARLLELVYGELRALAASHMRRERGDHTLSATALAHEAWLRFWQGSPGADLQSRHQFFAVAATAMRRILVEHARARRADKRGGSAQPIRVENLDAFSSPADDQLIALDEALGALSDLRPHAARVVELRFFGGFSHEQIGALLELERRTVDRDWAFARAWLLAALRREDTGRAKT
jgi:RNA polymerase sigma factor (TIGR02999 family)